MPSTEAKSSEDKKHEKHYPQESFTTDQLPSLKGVELGNKIRLVIEAEVCAVRSGSEYEYDSNKKNETRITLKLLSGSAKKMEDTKEDTTKEDKGPQTIKDKVKENSDKFDTMLKDDTGDE